MPLDRDTEKVVEQLDSLRDAPIESLSPADARRQPGPVDAVAAVLGEDGAAPVTESVAAVREETIDGPAGPVPLRIYAPRRTLRTKVRSALFAKDEHDPILIYLHGGGWVLDDQEGVDAVPRTLANRAQAMVVCVGYRRAPEHPLPAAHEDVLAATRWILEHAKEIGGDPARVAIGGEDAGATLATATCIALSDADEPAPILQLLVSPVTDLVRDDWDSYEEHGDARPLGVAQLEWFRRHAVPDDATADDVRVSPNRAPDDTLRGLPPALVVLAEIDPLRDQGRDYARRLRQVGVPVEVKECEGLPHEFLGMAPVSERAREVADEIGERLDFHFGMAVPAGRG